MLPGCAKGIWKDNIRISADELTFEAQGGSLKVWSKSGSEFSLDSYTRTANFRKTAKKCTAKTTLTLSDWKENGLKCHLKT